MIVLCIDDIKPVPGCKNVPGPVYGDIDTVRSTGYDNDLGYYYTLTRFPYHIGYSQCHFIPLSDLSETEMKRNYKKELV